MIKIKLNQYANRFELLYKKEQVTELKNIEELINRPERRAFCCSLSKEKFYFSKQVISIDNNGDKLTGEVQANDYKQLYLSYEVLNNRFNEMPVESFLNLNDYNKYEFEVDIVTVGNLKVLPYVIHYRETKKQKLTLIEKDKTIDFTEDDKCRLTFKIIGQGSFEIKLLRIIPKG